MTGVIKVDDIQDAGANSIVSSNGSGTLTLGSFTAPNITASTAILPDASDGAAIGSASLEWSDLFLADGAVINFGDDQEVTLTHVADTGITLNSTNKLMFNDASQFIQGASATVLDIAATDEIELTATLVDINANVEISGTAVTTGVHTFTAVPVFPNNTIETADIQADAITGAKIADDAINSEHYTDGSIDTAHIADGQVTTAKLATAVFTGATDIGAAIADADLILLDDGAGGTIRKSTASRIKTYIGDNTPAWFAQHADDSGTAFNDNSETAVPFAVEKVDTDGAFASNAFTVPSGGAGTYFVHTQAVLYDAANSINSHQLNIYVGSTQKLHHNVDHGGSTVHERATPTLSGILPLSEGDVVSVKLLINTIDGNTATAGGGGAGASLFFGFKLV